MQIIWIRSSSRKLMMHKAKVDRNKARTATTAPKLITQSKSGCYIDNEHKWPITGVLSTQECS
jgi:hypothetical protein